MTPASGLFQDVPLDEWALPAHRCETRDPPPAVPASVAPRRWSHRRERRRGTSSGHPRPGSSPSFFEGKERPVRSKNTPAYRPLR